MFFKITCRHCSPNICMSHAFIYINISSQLANSSLHLCSVVDSVAEEVDVVPADKSESSVQYCTK